MNIKSITEWKGKVEHTGAVSVLSCYHPFPSFYHQRLNMFSSWNQWSRKVFVLAPSPLLHTGRSHLHEGYLNTVMIYRGPFIVK